ncbi:hypothetical protein QBC43DRAFT_141998 [Cladorrhinum sp. PSN259]|nr:hypothetical protein QBC43DRAFT_141998 [Cladorrhinum sp. PSN259]
MAEQDPQQQQEQPSIPSAQPPSPSPTTAAEDPNQDPTTSLNFDDHIQVDDAAMQSMLGFSSFQSTTRPPKRRRSPGLSSHESSSGSNSIPLAKRAQTRIQTGAIQPQSLQVPSEDSSDGIDFNIPFEETDSDAPPGSTNPPSGTATPPPQTQTQPSHSLPQRPQFQSGRGGGRGGARGGARGGRGGAPFHNPEWYKTYYDPASNENPWWWLENDRGIQSEVNDWLEFVPRDKSTRFAGAAGVVAGFVGPDEGAI